LLCSPYAAPGPAAEGAGPTGPARPCAGGGCWASDEIAQPMGISREYARLRMKVVFGKLGRRGPAHTGLQAARAGG